MEKEQGTTKEPVSTKELVKVGITLGDLNGIGPEVTLKALKDNRILGDFTPVIYGSTKIISHYKKLLELQDFQYTACKDASEIQAKKINVINVWNEDVELQVGESTANGGMYAFKERFV